MLHEFVRDAVEPVEVQYDDPMDFCRHFCITHLNYAKNAWLEKQLIPMAQIGWMAVVDVQLACEVDMQYIAPAIKNRIMAWKENAHGPEHRLDAKKVF